MALKYVDFTEDEIVDQIEGKAQKKLVRAALAAYKENNLTYKIRQAWKPKNDNGSYYRIFFYIKKSKESMILNTNSYDNPGFCIQLRIKDRSILNQLEKFSKNVQNTILNGSDCRAPNCSNDGCEYVFEYQGREYRKCHMLCENFVFRDFEEEDVESLMTIIRNEIAFDKPVRKNSK